MFIFEHILSFILFLYENPHLIRKVVQDFIQYMHKFIRNIFMPFLKHEVLNIIENSESVKEIKTRLKSCFREYEKVFEEADTEAKRFRHLRRKGYI